MARNRAWMLVAVVTVVLSGFSQSAQAQYSSYFAHGNQSSGAMAPAGRFPAQMASYAMPGPMVPAGYQDEAGYEAYGEGEYVDEGYGCEECGEDCDGGCSSCAGGGLFGPYLDGSCGPRWFDISAEVLFLTREDAGRSYDFTSDGLNGPRVLGLDNLKYQEELGYRITGRYDLGAASNFEASYMGGFFWRTEGVANSGTDNLYSVMSNFGITPATGFVETDQATTHRIVYDTQLDSVEMSYRHHWVSPCLRIQGSWLVGFRYALFDETFGYQTHAELHNDPLNGNAPRGPGEMDYNIGTTNNMFGVQIGGDAYACLLPGLTVGGELKAGAYNNHARQHTRITATSVGGTIVEDVTTDDLAMIAEAGLIAVYQIGPGLSIRGGYELLYFDGVALGSENFNPNAPFLGAAPARIVSINDNGSAFFHGFTGGVEWMW